MADIFGRKLYFSIGLCLGAYRKQGFLLQLEIVNKYVEVHPRGSQAWSHLGGT